MKNELRDDAYIDGKRGINQEAGDTPLTLAMAGNGDKDDRLRTEAFMSTRSLD